MQTHTGNIDSEQDGGTAPEAALILISQLLARAAARDWAALHLGVSDSDPTTARSKGSPHEV